MVTGMGTPAGCAGIPSRLLTKQVILSRLSMRMPPASRTVFTLSTAPSSEAAACADTNATPFGFTTFFDSAVLSIVTCARSIGNAPT